MTRAQLRVNDSTRATNCACAICVERSALVRGSIRFLDAPEPVLAFVREHAGERLLLAFNLSSEPVAWNAPDEARAVVAAALGS